MLPPLATTSYWWRGSPSHSHLCCQITEDLAKRKMYGTSFTSPIRIENPDLKPILISRIYVIGTNALLVPPLNETWLRVCNSPHTRKNTRILSSWTEWAVSKTDRSNWKIASLISADATAYTNIYLGWYVMSISHLKPNRWKFLRRYSDEANVGRGW